MSNSSIALSSRGLTICIAKSVVLRRSPARIGARRRAGGRTRHSSSHRRLRVYASSSNDDDFATESKEKEEKDAKLAQLPTTREAAGTTLQSPERPDDQSTTTDIEVESVDNFQKFMLSLFQAADLDSVSLSLMLSPPGPYPSEADLEAFYQAVKNFFGSGTLPEDVQEAAAACRGAVPFFRLLCKETGLQWYDVDGNLVTNLSEERVGPFLSAFLSFIYLIEEENPSPETATWIPPCAVDWDEEKLIRQEVFGPGSPFFPSASIAGLNGCREFIGEMPTSLSSQELFAYLTLKTREQFPDLAVNLAPASLSLSSQWDEDEDQPSFSPLKLPLSFTAASVSFVRKDVFLEAAIPSLVSLSLLAASFYSFRSITLASPSLISSPDLAWSAGIFSLALAAPPFAMWLGRYMWTRSQGISAPLPVLPVAVPGFGPVFMFIQHLAALPSRSAMIDLALCTIMPSVITSLGLIAASANLRVGHIPAQFLTALHGMAPNAASSPAMEFSAPSAADATVSGVVLVKDSLLEHSAFLHEALVQLSTVYVTSGNGEDYLLAVHPLALAGLLGLNFSALSLLPLFGLPGGDILAAIAGGPLVPLALFFASLLFLIELWIYHPSWAWVILLFSATPLAMWWSSRPVWDTLTNTRILPTIMGASLLLLGMYLLLPPDAYPVILKQPPGFAVEELLMSYGLV